MRSGRLGLLACLAAAAVAAGCIPATPIAPHSTVVYAPHPSQADASLDLETLREAYTASPDVDPDGLGAMDWIWEQSYLVLSVWPIEEKRQSRAKIAYARTDQRQRQSLAEAKALYSDNIVFEGIWIGDFAESLDPAVYLPEGIYLVDDEGTKTLPLSANALDPLVARTAVRASDFGTAHVSFPLIVFPGGAITAGTRSVSLYVATPDRRMRFTWVFDPAYEAPSGMGGGRRGLWNTP